MNFQEIVMRLEHFWASQGCVVQLPLCIGEPVKLNQQYDDEQQRLEAYAAILDTYKQVQNQGDEIGRAHV